MSRVQKYLLTAVFFFLVTMTPAILAQTEKAPETEAEPTPPTLASPDKSTTEKTLEEKNEADENTDNRPTAADICGLPLLGEESWIDRMQRAVYRSVCGSAAWFDHFFGHEEVDRQHHATFGRLGLGLLWSEYDEFEVRSRFKVKLRLPRFEKRINAFLGSYKEDEFAPDRPDNFGSLPETFRETDQEWLAGLGYSPMRGRRKRVDMDAGVKLGFPMDPFVRVRLERHRFFNDTTLARFRQTLFWRGEKGLGTTSHLDLERVLGPRFHLRWRTEATVAEAVAGADWESALTLYHYLGGKRALAYEARIEGESDAPVPMKDLGVRAIYRQSMLRDWFYAEIRCGVSWPRTELSETRDESLSIGFGFELLFGDHP